MTYDCQDNHDLDYVYFLRNDNDDSVVYFKCTKERHRYARHLINDYCCDSYGWDTCVTQIITGTITHLVNMCNVVTRPDDLDTENFDRDGTNWCDFPHRCDYKLVPVETLRDESFEVIDQPSADAAKDGEPT